MLFAVVFGVIPASMRTFLFSAKFSSPLFCPAIMIFLDTARPFKAAVTVTSVKISALGICNALSETVIPSSFAETDHVTPSSIWIPSCTAAFSGTAATSDVTSNTFGKRIVSIYGFS